jgi:hypothetical protein
MVDMCSPSSRLQGGYERQPIFVSVDLRGGDDQQIVEAGIGQEARDRDAGEDATFGQTIDDLGGGLF